MFGLTWMHPIVGVDIHWVMVPTPAGPVPTPLPHPFTGVVFDPIGAAVSAAISGAMAAATGGPFKGPVLINMMPAANTGTDGTNTMVMPHFPTPPGTVWAPVPAGLKPPIPGKPPDPGVPTPVPSNDATMITGSKTVYIGGTNACRLGDLSMSCGEPVRLPSSTGIAFPWAAPVVIGGPPALDLMSAAFGFIRSSWMSGRLRGLTNKVLGEGTRAGRWASRLVCFLTGHPVDVMSGMVITEAVDVELPGHLPFRFERIYYSRSAEPGPLGHGWTHNLDQFIEAERDYLIYRAADGRDIFFPVLSSGERFTSQTERLTLHHHGKTLEIIDQERQSHFFERDPAQTGRWRLQALSNARSQRIEFHYDRTGCLQHALDSVGRLIEFKHDSAGRLRAITLPHPEQADQRFTAVRYEYDENGDLIAVYDALEQPMQFAYKHHLLVQETDRNGFSFYFAYDGVDSNARCVRTWGDGGIFDHVLVYDSERKVTLRKDSYDNETVFFGNEAGLVTKIIDSLGNTRTFDYDDSLRTVSEIDPLGGTLQMEYDSAGHLLSITDADGVSRHYEYDEFGQETSEIDGLGTCYQHEYNPFGELIDSSNPLGGGFYHEYDTNGNLRRIRSRSGKQVRLAWDKDANLAVVALPDEPHLRMHHDALGRLSHVSFPDGGEIRYIRDLLGRATRIESPRLGNFDYRYDGVGNRVACIDPNGTEIRYEYGEYNKLLAVEDPTQGTRRFEFDREGSLLAIVNEKGERCEYELDSEGNTISVKDFADCVTEFKHDGAGRICEITDNQNQTRKLDWTPGGRLQAVTYPDGCFETYEYDDNGRILKAINESGVIERRYDAIGRLQEERWNDDFSLRHDYDLDDQRVQTKTSDGVGIDYRYDGGGRLKSLQVNQRWRIQREYNKFGNPVRQLFPGGHIEQRSYDEHQNLFEQRLDRHGKHLLSGRQYQFTPDGELSALFDKQRGLSQFTLGRHGLEKVVHNGQARESYSYDSTGNRLILDASTRIGSGDRLERQGELAYEYDQEGRVVGRSQADQTASYQYNARGQLIKTYGPDGRVFEYAYDAFGRRVSKRCEEFEVHWTWLDGNPFREQTVYKNRHETRYYFFEPDTAIPLAALHNERFLSYITDHIGTPQEIINEQGDVVWAAEYSAFGEIQRELNKGFDNALRFPGQYHDRETGLYYNHHRYYDPATARYTTPDPWGVNGGLNLYAYPTNPLTWADPLGLQKGCARQFMSSYMIFLKTGIRPKHARAIMRVAQREGLEVGFRNIRWWKRAQSMLAGMFGVPPKPLSTKGKVKVHGTVKDPNTGQRFRSDYDPAFYRKDGKVLSNDEALEVNRKINQEIGHEEVQHGTHLTMDQAGVPPHKVDEIGPPGDTTVIKVDPETGAPSTSSMKDTDMIGDPSLPWLW